MYILYLFRTLVALLNKVAVAAATAALGTLLLKQQFSCVLYPIGVRVVVGISPRGEISPHYYYVVVGLPQLYCTTCVSEQQERICEYTKNGNEKTQSTQIEHLPLFWYLPVTNCTTRFSERGELAKNGKIKIYKCVMYFFPLVFQFCLFEIQCAYRYTFLCYCTGYSAILNFYFSLQCSIVHLIR